jgi:hypothetical protein
MKRITSLLLIAVFFASCEGMKTDIEISSSKFPPKLNVTAILDGYDGSFTVILREGRALADYKPPGRPNLPIIKDGRIRLYKDSVLILTEIGTFDLMHDSGSWECEYNEWGFSTSCGYVRDREGHRFETIIGSITVGSVYRLEIEVDGYETVYAESVMPAPPDVSVPNPIDTMRYVTKNRVKSYKSLGGGWGGGSGGDRNFWHFDLMFGTPPSERNYYAIEMLQEMRGYTLSGVYVDDIAKIQGNPEIEIDSNFEIDFVDGAEIVDLYNFDILIMSDIGFTEKETSLTMFKYEETYTTKLTAEEIEEREKLCRCEIEEIQHDIIVTVRVRQLTQETFFYYRSLAMQDVSIGFFGEPVNIVSNIKNGYGSFIVHNAKEFEVLNIIRYEYRYEYVYGR